MKKFTAVVLAFALLAAACGDDDAADPASITTCEGAADATITLLQKVIDIIGGLDPAALGALMAGEMPDSFTALEETATVIGLKAEELACDNLPALLTDRADQLTAADDNAIGQLIIQGVVDGDEDVIGRLFR
jgi:hypothetical protein